MKFYVFIICVLLNTTIVGWSQITGTGAIYIGSNTGDPWGVPNNQQAMDSVFGVGGWTQQYFETLNPATTFDANNCFVFIEGGDLTSIIFSNFLTTNLPLIQNWVSMGGRLIMNAAPNEGGNIDYGFGGVTLNYDSVTTLAYNGNASPGMAGHPIFNGPFLPCGSSLTGVFFAHAWISGGGTTALIEDTPGPSLTEKVWGAGRVLFGGMTTSIWHLPTLNGENLMANIIKYQQLCTTPLPVELVSFTGECTASGTLLKWTTSSEINNAEFIIESSTDGINYKTDGNVAGNGNSNVLIDYSYVSPLRAKPGNYFRLKQKDFNGDEKTYDPIYIACSWLIKPNCAVLNVSNNQIELDVFSTKNEDITCTLLDIRGGVLQTHQMHTTKGANTMHMDATGLSNGVYLVMVMGEDHQCVLKFLNY